MSRFLTMLPGVLIVGGSLAAQVPVLEPVFHAEQAFAQLAGEKGIRTAFLTWLTEDAEVFAPRMTGAKDQYGPEPGDPGYLSWYPEAMGIAASGDLAWSFGPWTYAVKKGAPVLVNGHFLSIWRRQADGHWKVEADIGVPHAAPERPIELFVIHDAAANVRISRPKVPDAAAVLLRKEAELSAAWAERGGLALVPNLAKEARVLRRGRLPLRGGADIQTVLGADRPGPKWEPTRIQTAASGELAWTCGETGPDDRGVSASFLRVWTLEADAWKVLFDVRLPHPAAAK